MSLRPLSKVCLPKQTARVARQAFVRGNRYLMLRHELCTIYADDCFASLFLPTGSQPALGLLNFQETLNPLMQR